MLLEAKRWIETELPWWRRRQGNDHIWYAISPVCIASVAPWRCCLAVDSHLAGIRHLELIKSGAPIQETRNVRALTQSI